MGRLTAGKTEDKGVLATVDIFLFEGFRLDRQGDGLSRHDERGVFVPYTNRAPGLDVLSALVELSGDLVPKEEIMARQPSRADSRRRYGARGTAHARASVAARVVRFCS